MNAFDRLIIKLYKWRKPKFPGRAESFVPDSQYGTKEECLSKLSELGLYVPGVTLLPMQEDGDMTWAMGFISLNPLDHPGIAIRLMWKYGLKLAPGITHGCVKAYFPNTDEPWCWADRSTMQRAICDCLIICKERGLI